ncbi:hypothetical protein ILUMI_02069 [Ignelater luminosus]|uniref:Integrase catalytic domain-containing protein n=1 Tax=Ignelater luminosus TaxID=2038154 RepID=A0A8K0DIV7_IGNLU|nr:hypothetical protein ILUMI_02069 [Ignelater luminosus]
MEFSKHIRPLSGEADWPIWKKKIRDLLDYHKGALDVIDGKLKKPDALASSATEDEVKKHKEQSDLFCKANSYAKFMIAVTDTFGWTSTDDVSTHIAKLKRMWQKINNGLKERKEHPLPDLMIVYKVLSILPSGFSSFQSIWMMLTDSTKKTLDQLVIQLCAYEKTFLKVGSSNSVVQEALQVKHTSKKTQGKPFKSKVKKWDVCNYCKLEGHWIYQCPKWTADGKPKRSEPAAANDASILLVEAEAFSVERDSATWWVNNGATKHVSNSIEYFTKFYKFESLCGVKGAGQGILPAVGAEKILLYHERWGHQDRRHVRAMLQRELDINVPLEKICVSHVSMEKHIDYPLGTEKVQVSQGNWFQLTFANLLVSLLERKEKSEVRLVFRDFLQYAKTVRHTVKKFLSDNGGELDNKDVRDMLQTEGITQRLTAPYTPEQNDGSEREFRTCIVMARTFKYSSSKASFPEALWAELVATATYILYKTGKSLKEGVSPYELWTGKKPRIKHLRIIGSVCSAHIPTQKRQKMDKKAIKGYLVGYDGQCKEHVKLPMKDIESPNEGKKDDFMSELEDQSESSEEENLLDCNFEPPEDYEEPLEALSKNLRDRCKDGSVKICQQAYAKKILERFGQDCKPVSTPMTKKLENSKQSRKSDKASDSPYRQAVGALMYLMVGTRPDLAFSVSFLSRSLDYPSIEDIGRLKRVLRFHGKEYLKLIDFLKNPIFLSYSEDLDHYMAKSIKQSVLLTNGYRVVAVTIMVGYTIYPLLDNKPLPTPFPYDLGKFTMLMYCFEVISGSFSMVNVICLDVTCTSLMELAAAQLDILAEKIIRLEEDDVVVGDPIILTQIRESIHEKLKNCVKHHLAIIK